MWAFVHYDACSDCAVRVFWRVQPSSRSKALHWCVLFRFLLIFSLNWFSMCNSNYSTAKCFASWWRTGFHNGNNCPNKQAICLQILKIKFLVAIFFEFNLLVFCNLFFIRTGLIFVIIWSQTLSCMFSMEENRQLLHGSAYIYSIGDRICTISVQNSQTFVPNPDSLCFFENSASPYEFRALDFNYRRGELYFSENNFRIHSIRRAHIVEKHNNSAVIHGIGLVKG